MRILILFGFAAFLTASSIKPSIADCTCLNRGTEVKEGKTACIKTANGEQLALCEKNLNVTNWKFLGEECPTALNKARKEQEVALKK